MVPVPELETYSKETVMESIKILGYLFCFLLGVAVGWWSYRYTLKRDPERLEKIAQQINKAQK